MTTRRFTVMGFTEAELGFVLAAVFAALAASALTPQQSRQSAATLAARERHAVEEIRQRLHRVRCVP